MIMNASPPPLPGRFITIRPLGNPVLNTFNFGREILMLGGQATVLGTWVINVQGYACAVTVGNAINVLVGNVIWIGGGIVSVNGGQAQFGAGMQMFVGESASAIFSHSVL